MSETDPIVTAQAATPAPVSSVPQISLDAEELKYHQSMQAYSKLLEKGTPWLFDVGSWVFGGLIAFTLLILSALITVGPVDLAIKVATAAFALALPLDVTGLVLLRLVQDMTPGNFEQEVAQTFQQVGLKTDDMQIPSLTSLQAMRIRGTQIALSFALGILVFSGVLTLVGISAAFWHMAWWIAAAFVAMVLVSFCIAMLAMTISQPPVSKAERQRRNQYRNEVVRQAKERARQEKAAARKANRKR